MSPPYLISAFASFTMALMIPDGFYFVLVQAVLPPPSPYNLKFQWPVLYAAENSSPAPYNGPPKAPQAPGHLYVSSAPSNPDKVSPAPFHVCLTPGLQPS